MRLNLGVSTTCICTAWQHFYSPKFCFFQLTHILSSEPVSNHMVDEHNVNSLLRKYSKCDEYQWIWCNTTLHCFSSNRSAALGGSDRGYSHVEATLLPVFTVWPETDAAYIYIYINIPERCQLVYLLNHFIGCWISPYFSHLKQWIINWYNTGAFARSSATRCDLFLMGVTLFLIHFIQSAVFTHFYHWLTVHTAEKKRAKFGHKWRRCQNTKEWKIYSLEENVR